MSGGAYIELKKTKKKKVTCRIITLMPDVKANGNMWDRRPREIFAHVRVLWNLFL